MTGKPAAVILHNLVGLLHACMAVYYALSLTASHCSSWAPPARWTKASAARISTGTHTALVQGNAVRDYTKRDYQPSSIHGVPEFFARAYSIMTMQPTGPIYMCYDAALQEAPLTEKIALPPIDSVDARARMMPESRRRWSRSRTSSWPPSTRC